MTTRGDGASLAMHHSYLKEAPSVAYGGTVLKTEVKPDAVTVTVKVDATATNATVTVKGHCDAGPSNIMAQITWTGALKEGTSTASSARAIAVAFAEGHVKQGHETGDVQR